MQVADFLVELGTEELPPKALLSLARAFAEGIENGLRQARLDMGQVRHFAAPRRLAVKVSSLAVRQPDQVIERLGPAVAAAWQEDGTPTKACEGFARSCGTTPDQLITVETDKGARVGYRTRQAHSRTVAGNCQSGSGCAAHSQAHALGCPPCGICPPRALARDAAW